MEIYRIVFCLLNNLYHKNKKIEFMYIRCSRACPWSASWGRSRCRPPGGWSRWTLSGRCPQPYTLINQLITQASRRMELLNAVRRCSHPYTWMNESINHPGLHEDGVFEHCQADVLILIPEWMNESFNHPGLHEDGIVERSLADVKFKPKSINQLPRPPGGWSRCQADVLNLIPDQSINQSPRP